MKKVLYCSLLFLSCSILLKAQKKSLEHLLFELPDVVFKKIESSDAFESIYELKIKQPLDHKQPSKGFFYQKAFLSHKGFDRPTVMITEGYSRNKNRIYELTRLLDANQIDIEHRFYGESLPDSLDYNYLNLEQATADLHRINQLFRKIYAKKWISTGISKGGVTTLFYRYFYPNDVTVSVPYVAPINKAFEEQRIYQFLDTIGTDVCRNKILFLQQRLLKNRDKILPLLKFYSKGADLNYSYLTLEQAFEYTVLEYPFSFWQFGHDCNKIPDDTVSLHSAVEYFMDVSEIGFFSDSEIERLGPHYYQSASEMGYYGYETEDFKGLLQALPATSNPHATFVPGKMPVKFDGTLLKNMHKWLNTQGNQIIYIYGAIDTWSASAVPPSEKVDAVWFFLKGKHHVNARIKNMSDEERQKLISTLEKWLD